MHLDIVMLGFRNLVLLALFMLVIVSGNAPMVEQELLKLWKSLKTPILFKRPAKTNHKSNKFWEIDMTKLEP